MSRTHGQADTYVGDELRWKLAIVVENPGGLLTVKAKRDDKPGVWEKVLKLTDAVFVGRNGDANRWTGTDPDGNPVTITTVPRKRGGCSSCGG